MDKVENIRKKIDVLDDRILQLLQDRITLMQQVGQAKKESQVTIRDYEREAQKLTNIEKKAAILDIPAVLVINLWKLFFEISEKVEK